MGIPWKCQGSARWRRILEHAGWLFSLITSLIGPPEVVHAIIMSWFDTLLAIPGLVTTLYLLGGAAGFSLAMAIATEWRWSTGAGGQFQALAPELKRIRDEGITYADIDWIKGQLKCVQIASPPRYGTIDVMPTDKIMEGPVRAKWNNFLSQLVPLAQRGNVEEARKLSTSLTEVEAGPL